MAQVPDSWDKKVHDFGKVEQGKPVKAQFFFKSSEVVEIEFAKASSGSVAVEYRKSPILPGEAGWVTAVFNAANPGRFEKTISLKFKNVDDFVVLTIRGEVLPAD